MLEVMQLESLKLVAVVVILRLYSETCALCVCVCECHNKIMGDGKVEGVQSKKKHDEVVHGGTLVMVVHF